MGKLKEYSRSDKPSVFPSRGSCYGAFPTNQGISVWEAAAEAEAKMKASAAEEVEKKAAEIQRRRDEIKRHSISPE